MERESIRVTRSVLLPLAGDRAARLALERAGRPARAEVLDAGRGALRRRGVRGADGHAEAARRRRRPDRCCARSRRTSGASCATASSRSSGSSSSCARRSPVQRRRVATKPTQRRASDGSSEEARADEALRRPPDDEAGTAQRRLERAGCPAPAVAPRLPERRLGRRGRAPARERCFAGAAAAERTRLLDNLGRLRREVGPITPELSDALADHMNIRRGEVHEVVSFYSFLQVPIDAVRVCTGPGLRLLRRARAARGDTRRDRGAVPRPLRPRAGR